MCAAGRVKLKKLNEKLVNITAITMQWRVSPKEDMHVP